MSALKALVIGLVAVLAALVSWIVDVIEKYGADEHQTDELVELAEKCLGQGDGYEYKIEKRADGSFVVKCAKGLESDKLPKPWRPNLAVRMHVSQAQRLIGLLRSIRLAM